MKPSAPSNDYKSESENTGQDPDFSEEELVAHCVNGDRRAQHELFSRYKQLVYSMVFRTLGTGFDIDDITQQVFISLFRSLRNFEGRSSLDTWVYRIISRVCTDQIRKKYRKRKISLQSTSTSDGGEIQGTDDLDPEKSYEQREFAKEFYDVLHSMSEDKRTAIILYEIHGHSLEAIADILKKPVGTIKSRLFHARRDLEKGMGKYLKG